MQKSLPQSPRSIRIPHLAGMWTLYLRELKKFRRLWMMHLASPLVAGAMNYIVFALGLPDEMGAEERARTLDYIIAGQILFWCIFKACESVCISVMLDKLERTIEDLMMAPLGPTELLLAYGAAGTTNGLAAGSVLLVASWLVLPITIPSIGLVLGFAVGGALLMALVGLLIGLWADKWDHVGAAFGFLIIPLSFLSGMFAPIDRLPGPLALLMALNPITYAIDGFRGGLVGLGEGSPLLAAGAVAAGCTLAAALAGFLLNRGYKLRA